MEDVTDKNSRELTKEEFSKFINMAFIIQ